MNRGRRIACTDMSRGREMDGIVFSRTGERIPTTVAVTHGDRRECIRIHERRGALGLHTGCCGRELRVGVSLGGAGDLRGRVA
jgi:hypothetical protein